MKVDVKLKVYVIGGTRGNEGGCQVKVYVLGGIRGNEGGCQVKGLCTRWYTR